MKILSYIKKGNSFPIICQKNEATYFVKLNAGMSGPYGLINEWIGNQIGQQLGLNTQIPSWIELTEELEYDEIYIEVRELIQKSIGWNIGFPYQENGVEVKLEELEMLDKKVAAEIFLFDLVMLNVDRTPGNLNLMQVNNTIYTIDYESSLLFQSIISNKKLLENLQILKSFKANPLYQEIDQSTINQFLFKLAKVDFEKVVAEIPTHIIQPTHRDIFLKGIIHHQSNNWFLQSAMEALKSITIETPEEQKLRRNKNQADFRKNMK